MDNLESEDYGLGDSQYGDQQSDKYDDSSSGAGGMYFVLEYDIGDEGREAVRRISELYGKLHEMEFPAIADVFEANKQMQAITRSFALSNSARQLASAVALN